MSAHQFKAGDPVVCVKRGGWLDSDVGGPMEGAPHPKYGEICVIADLSVSPFDGRVYITVEGYAPFSHYLASNFRPVQRRSTDISIFTAMLTKPRVPA